MDCNHYGENSMMHVRVAFGSDNKDPVVWDRVIKFDTEAEARAYCRGLDDAVGYMGVTAELLNSPEAVAALAMGLDLPEGSTECLVENY